MLEEKYERVVEFQLCNHDGEVLFVGKDTLREQGSMDEVVDKMKRLIENENTYYTSMADFTITPCEKVSWGDELGDIDVENCEELVRALDNRGISHSEPHKGIHRGVTYDVCYVGGDSKATVEVWWSVNVGKAKHRLVIHSVIDSRSRYHGMYFDVLTVLGCGSVGCKVHGATEVEIMLSK